MTFSSPMEMKRTVIVQACMAAALAAAAGSPYVARVYDYMPAPGQFINTLPVWEQGMTAGDMTSAAAEQLVGDARPGMLCLGSFGGYVVFGFDHPLVNVPGEYDLKIYGNAIISDPTLRGGNCEPGVVWVSTDDNCNGLPDDTWYELAGSECGNPATVHGFRITYHRPDPNHTPVAHPSDRTITDTEYLLWTSENLSHPSGFLQANSFHRQSYWPEWIDADEITLEGTLLPPNAVDTNGKGTAWTLLAFDGGYVDNLPNDEDPGLKLDWAVNADGTPVALTKVDFIKVQSGMLQSCGWLGETSTEVCGAEDLHPDAVAESHTGMIDNTFDTDIRLAAGYLIISAPAGTDVRVYPLSGMQICRFRTTGETHIINTTSWPRGIYIVAAGGCHKKLRIN